MHFNPPVMREGAKGKSWSRSSGKGLDVEVNGQSLGLGERGNGGVWDADEKSHRRTDHLKINNGPILRRTQSFNLVSRLGPILYLIKTWEAISESEPEVDAVVVSSPVEGYESSDLLVLGLLSLPLLLFRPSRRRRFTSDTPRCLLKSNCSRKTRSRPARRFPHTRNTPPRCLMYFVYTVAYIPLLSKLPEDVERPETIVG